MENKQDIQIGRLSPINFNLTEEQKNSYGKIIILNNIYNGNKFQVGCESNDIQLNDWIITLLSEDLITQEQKNDGNTYYTITKKGKDYIHNLIQRNNEFNIVYQIFRHVDLENGLFAHSKFFDLGGNNDSNTWFNYIDKDTWTDLRACVAYYKGLNPTDVIFLNTVFDNNDYLNFKTDKDLSISILNSFINLEKIVNDQYVWEELCGRLKDNTSFTEEEIDYARDVIEDVINQGSNILKELLEKEKELSEQYNNQPEEYYGEDNEVVETTTTEIVEETIIEENNYVENYAYDPSHINKKYLF